MKRVGGKTMAGIMNKVLELFTSEDYEDEEEEVHVKQKPLQPKPRRSARLMNS